MSTLACKLQTIRSTARIFEFKDELSEPTVAADQQLSKVILVESVWRYKTKASKSGLLANHLIQDGNIVIGRKVDQLKIFIHRT